MPIANPSRREFLAAAAAKLAERPPNLLFVLADQWRAQALPAAGDTDLRAPNLHRLATEGVHFRRAYASYPLCTPARASFLTGRFPHAARTVRNSVRLPLGEPSIAAQLKAAGYATGYIGKWHLDGEERPGFVPPGERRRGFDYWAAFNRGHAYFDSTYFRDSPEPIRPGGFEPDYQTSLAIDFIRANRSRPFFLFLSWGPPHTPRTPPPAFARMYDPRQFRLRENVPAEYEETARRGLAGYYGLCSALDANLGRLLKALDEQDPGPLGDRDALATVTAQADVVTYEWEGVPADAVRALGDRVVVRPGWRALAVAQDRLEEKTAFRRLGIAVPEFAPVDDLADLDAALETIGTPAILKTRRGGYDEIGRAHV